MENNSVGNQGSIPPKRRQPMPLPINLEKKDSLDINASQIISKVNSPREKVAENGKINNPVTVKSNVSLNKKLLEIQSKTVEICGELNELFILIESIKKEFDNGIVVGNNKNLEKATLQLEKIKDQIEIFVQELLPFKPEIRNLFEFVQAINISLSTAQESDQIDKVSFKILSLNKLVSEELGRLSAASTINLPAVSRPIKPGQRPTTPAPLLPPAKSVRRALTIEEEIDEFELLEVEKEITTDKGIEALEKDNDRIEGSDWRANEKYRLVGSQIRKGLGEMLAPSESLEKDFNADVRNLKDILSKRLMQIKEAPANGSSSDLCEHYIALAFYALENPQKFDNERQAFKEYKIQMREALNTEFYVKNPESPHAKLLNKLAFAEYAYVHVQGFTESVAQRSAEIGNFKSKPIPVVESNLSLLTPDQQKHVHSLKQVLSDLEEYHHAIQNYSNSPEGIASTLRGEIFCLGLDSVMQGNPANVKFKVEDSQGHEITNVRTPSPTGKDGQVNPEFKAFLRELKARNQSYAMINLQDRTIPTWEKYLTNRNGENLRAGNLEALQNDPEFADMFTCFTLDKNSLFFKQSNPDPMPADLFKTEFMKNLEDPLSGFYIPRKFMNDERRAEIQRKLDMVHRTVFNNNDLLSQKERQDFIEVAYIFLADYYVKETNASFYNESCKDCIDRGGGANWTMMTLLIILEIFDPARKHNASSGLSVRIQNLPADLEADAIWARKRPVISERLERAHGAIDAMVKALEQNPSLCTEWSKELNLKKLILKADTAQTTEDPALYSKEEIASRLLLQGERSMDQLKIRTIKSDVGVVIPINLLNECRQDVNFAANTDKETIRAVANNGKICGNAQPLHVPNSDAIWTSLAITGDKIGENQTVPTSMRSDNVQENDLANFKLQISNDGHICITCGVIDTQQKADEFIAGVCLALSKKTPSANQRPLRIVLHQVNSQWGEPKLTSAQNKMSHYIENRLRELISLGQLPAGSQSSSSPMVVHLNTSLNLTSAMPSWFEDSSSYLSNVFGLATQCIWVMDDLFAADKMLSSMPIAEEIRVKLKNMFSEGQTQTVDSKADILAKIRYAQKRIEDLMEEIIPGEKSSKREAEILSIITEIKLEGDFRAKDALIIKLERLQIDNIRIEIAEQQASVEALNMSLETYLTPIIALGPLAQIAKIQEKIARFTTDRKILESKMLATTDKEELKLIEDEMESIRNGSDHFEEENIKITEKRLQDLEGRKAGIIKRSGDPSVQLMLSGIDAELNLLQNELLVSQRSLQAEMGAIANSFNTLNIDLNKICDSGKSTAEQIMMKNEIQILNLLIGKQTGNGQGALDMSRNQELELSLILDILLGSITEINCKSGLDRTGLVRCMWDSLNSMKEQFYKEYTAIGLSSKEADAKSLEKLIELVLKQEEHTFELNVIQSEQAKSSSMRKDLIATIEKTYPDNLEKQNALKNTLFYQDLIFANFLSVAQPITFLSTGVAGLKYGHGNTSFGVSIPGNPHPLARLPMFVSTIDGSTIQLYTFARWFGMGPAGLSSLGHRMPYLTEEGRLLLQRCSNMRGE
jgi:hypothetical protein